MSTVIKSGKEKQIEQGNIKYRITCTNCNSDIEYFASEIFVEKRSPFIFNVPNFLKSEYRFLKCPECDYNICETDYNRQRIS